jgi:hypothetical protein
MATADTLTSVPLPVSPALAPIGSAPEIPRKESAVPKPLLNIRESSPKTERVQFDQKKHLQYTPPSKTYSMKELGYSDDVGLSPIGVSEPFPLFSAEAIKQIRAEVLSDDVWAHYQFSSNLAQCQLRGFAPE